MHEIYTHFPTIGTIAEGTKDGWNAGPGILTRVTTTWIIGYEIPNATL